MPAMRAWISEPARNRIRELMCHARDLYRPVGLSAACRPNQAERGRGRCGWGSRPSRSVYGVFRMPRVRHALAGASPHGPRPSAVRGTDSCAVARYRLCVGSSRSSIEPLRDVAAIVDQRRVFEEHTTMSQTEADGDRGIGTPDQPPVEPSGERSTLRSAAPQRCDTNCTNHAVGCASLRERLAWDRILALHREGQTQADPAKVPKV
jgi:hypothetical protein